MNERFLNTSVSDTAQLLLSALNAPARPVVVLCLGSDRVLFDCAGPLTGTLLTAQLRLPAFVYGTLTHPVHALNVTAALGHIKRRHPDAQVLCVDACLGAKDDIGRLCVRRGGIVPGAAAGKRLPVAGDTGLTLTVATRESKGADARLGLVYALAHSAAQLIASTVPRIQVCNNNISSSCDKHIKPTLKFD